MSHLAVKIPFTSDELNCRCGCNEAGVTEEALIRLAALRSLVGMPMPITSAYRCPKHPVEAKKAKAGQHAKGVAFDIKITNAIQAGRILKYASMLGFNGIGIAKTFIHVDLRETPTYWAY